MKIPATVIITFLRHNQDIFKKTSPEF